MTSKANDKAKAIQNAAAIFEEGCVHTQHSGLLPEVCDECSAMFVTIIGEILSGKRERVADFRRKANRAARAEAG